MSPSYHSFLEQQYLNLKALFDYLPKFANGKVIVPAILSIFECFQSKFETMFSDTREEFLKLCRKRDLKIDRINIKIFLFKKTVDVLEQNDSYESRD